MRPWTNWPRMACWLLLALAVLVQLRIGWHSMHGDLADSDPPAHFTTGVLFHDYLKHFPPARPLPFAECFYVRYPKVALGHWPPAFYVAECLWFLCFGVSAQAARVLCALIAGCLATVLWRHTSRHWGESSGLIAAALLLTFPWIQSQGWRVMSDIFLGLFVYLALARFGAWMGTGTARNLWWYALWTSLAILTKATGWLLPLAFLLAPALAGRSLAYRDRTYWLCMALPAIVSAPFFVYAEVLHLSYPAKFAKQMQGLAGTSVEALLPRVAVFLLVAGTAYVLPRRLPRTPLAATCFSMALWIAAQAAFGLVFPDVTHEWDRFFILSLAPAIFLAAGIVSAFISRAKPWLLIDSVVPLLIGCCAMAWFGLVSVPQVTGYAAAIDSIPRREAGPVIWVQSDAVGEGALIVRRLETDRARSAYVIRGSKILSDSTWSGYRYRLRWDNPEAVDILLDQIPVDFILLDTSARPTPDTELVRRSLESPDSKFSLRTAYPVHGRAPGEVRIYERRSVLPPRPVTLSVILGPERGHRTISCRE